MTWQHATLSRWWQCMPSSPSAICRWVITLPFLFFLSHQMLGPHHHGWCGNHTTSTWPRPQQQPAPPQAQAQQQKQLQPSAWVQPLTTHVQRQQLMDRNDCPDHCLRVMHYLCVKCRELSMKVVWWCGSAPSSIHDALLVLSFSFCPIKFAFSFFLFTQSESPTKIRECARWDVDRDIARSRHFKITGGCTLLQQEKGQDYVIVLQLCAFNAILKEWGFVVKFIRFLISYASIRCFCFYFICNRTFPLKAFLKGWTVGSSIDAGDVHTEGSSDARK